AWSSRLFSSATWIAASGVSVPCNSVWTSSATCASKAVSRFQTTCLPLRAATVAWTSEKPACWSTVAQPVISGSSTQHAPTNCAAPLLPPPLQNVEVASVVSCTCPSLMQLLNGDDGLCLRVEGKTNGVSCLQRGKQRWWGDGVAHRHRT